MEYYNASEWAYILMNNNSSNVSQALFVLFSEGSNTRKSQFSKHQQLDIMQSARDATLAAQVYFQHNFLSGWSAATGLNGHY